MDVCNMAFLGVVVNWLLCSVLLLSLHNRVILMVSLALVDRTKILLFNRLL